MKTTIIMVTMRLLFIIIVKVSLTICGFGRSVAISSLKFPLASQVLCKGGLVVHNYFVKRFFFFYVSVFSVVLWI